MFEKNPFTMENLQKFWKKPAVHSVAASLLSILFGFVISFFIILITSLANQDKLPIDQAMKGFKILINALFYSAEDGFGAINLKNVGDMLSRATPLIMTGLSVAIAYKTGLFNIGASGQYVAGILGTLLVGLTLGDTDMPKVLVWILSFLAGAVAGFIWGCIPGLFKAFLNVNEVITSIMCNWIILHIAHWIFEMDYKKGAAGALFVNLRESTKSNFLLKTSYYDVSTTTLGLDKLFPNSSVDAGILIAIAFAIIIAIVLNKTTFGYELKATGKNRHASKYAGMNDKRNIILSMGIAGALAAIGASLWYLGAGHEYNWTVNTSLPSEGFNGIPVAFLAFCNPIGTAVAACFMAYVNMAGEQVRGAVAINAHISDLIVAIIVYLSAFSLMFQQILDGKGILTQAIKKLVQKIKESKQAKVEEEE